jgi:hypothetical protein
MRRESALFAITFLFAFHCLGFAQDPFEIALQQVGLTRETMKFDYKEMSNFGGDEFSLPLFHTLHSEPFKIPDYLDYLRKVIKEKPESLHHLVVFSNLRLGCGVRRGVYDFNNPVPEFYKRGATENPLFDAVVSLHENAEVELSEQERSELKSRAEKVPPTVGLQAAVIIRALTDSLAWRDLALYEAMGSFDMEDMYRQVTRMVTSEEEHFSGEIYRLIKAVDYKYLYSGAEDLALAVDAACDSLAAFNENVTFSFEYDTPLGVISLNGVQTNHYAEDRNYLLIIDTGGDDTYRGGAATLCFSHPYSVLIDLDGKDKYICGSDQKPSFGGGVFGYAYLVDLRGDDDYSGINLSQGSGLFGVGILLDKSGDDTYSAYTSSQGSGAFGIGLLSDLSGDDSYYCFTTSQGYGFTKGLGLLIEMRGDDNYVAEDTKIDFPSSQTKEHNSSLAQGVGFGRRADISDGHSLGGGIGILLDNEGKDSYSAGLFAQGCAYWYAIGLLADEAGDDEYRGIWYVQGSGAHFGLGILNDVRGNDHYIATMNMAQGAGHDFTLGYLLEEEGNDVYDCPNLSLGGGNANGIGIFWDKRGDDTYNPSGQITLGRANIGSSGYLRDHLLCLGLFLDTGGNDTYSKPFAGNNTIWTQPGLSPDAPLEAEKGVGLDGEYAK